MLVLTDVSEAKELLAIQHQSFAALYETYQDQYNPAIETLDYFQSRFARPNCRYYKIIEEEKIVGLIRTTVADHADQGWLGLIGIHPAVKRWVLCTVLQEAKLVRFYEKLGQNRARAGRDGYGLYGETQVNHIYCW